MYNEANIFMSEQNKSIQTLLNEINNSTNEALKTQKLSSLANLMTAEMNKIIEEEFAEELDDDEEEEEKDDEEEEEKDKKKKKKKGKVPTIAEVIADEGKFAILAGKFQTKFGLMLQKTGNGTEILLNQGSTKPIITFTTSGNGLNYKEIKYKQTQDKQEKKKKDNSKLIMILLIILAIMFVCLAVFLIKYFHDKNQHEQQIEDRKNELKDGVETREKDNKITETEKTDSTTNVTDANGRTQTVNTTSNISTSAGTVNRTTASALAEQLESQNSGATLNGVSIRDIKIKQDGSVTYYDVLSPNAHTTTVEQLKGNLSLNGTIVSDEVLTIAQNRTQNVSTGEVNLSNVSAVTSYNDDTKMGTIELYTGDVKYAEYTLPNLSEKDGIYYSTTDGTTTKLDDWQQQIYTHIDHGLDTFYPTTQDLNSLTLS